MNMTVQYDCPIWLSNMTVQYTRDRFHAHHTYLQLNLNVTWCITQADDALM